MEIKRYTVWLVNLDPTVGSEIKKTRPAVVISPDWLNIRLRTVIIAPMTTKIRNWSTRVRVNFLGKEGEIVLDQIRTIDKRRLVKYLGEIDEETAKEIKEVLRKLLTE